LFIRFALTKKSGLRWWDLVHLVPTLFHFFAFLPFYLIPTAPKLEILRDVLSNPLGAFAYREGLLTDFQHIRLMGALGLGYAIAMFWLMHASKKDSNSVLVNAPKLNRLLWIFILLQFIFAIAPIVLLSFPEWGFENLRGTLLYLVLGLCQLAAAIIFIFYPNLNKELTGLATEEDRAVPMKPEPEDSFPQVGLGKVEVEESASYSLASGESATQQPLIIQLEEFVAAQKSFLIKNISAAALANQLDVTADQVKRALNEEFGLRFNDYMNLKRIEYMESCILKEELTKYTLESIALESGFNTRITFIRATNKLKGCSPKVHFRKVIKQHKMMKVRGLDNRNGEKFKKAYNL
jgi:AraC-like DNA-binding protein